MTQREFEYHEKLVELVNSMNRLGETLDKLESPFPSCNQQKSSCTPPMKDIKGFEGKYAVTEDGRIWSYKRKKFLKPAGYGKGYLQVWLTQDKDKERRSGSYYVHRLVAETYIPNPDNLPEVNHKDENKENPHKDNLEWCTTKYNKHYGTRIDRISKPVYCVELDRHFGSIKAAARALKLQQSNLSACLKGVNETCGGYHWRYDT